MRKSILAVAIAAATVASTASAAGFYLKELSITGQGRAFAGEVTNTEDPSAVYFNPAATAGMNQSSTIAVGGHVITPSAKVTNEGSVFSNGNDGPTLPTTSTRNPYSTSVLPNLYATVPTEIGVVGLGVNNPFGLTNKYSKDSFVRYDSIETELKTPSFNFSLGRAVNDKLSIGFGIEAQKGEAVLESALPISNTTPNYIGDINSRLTAESDFELTPFFGVTFQASESTVVGFSYRKGIDHVANGKILVTPNTSTSGDQTAFAAFATNLVGGSDGDPADALTAQETAVRDGIIAAGSYTIENAKAELSTPSIASIGIKHAMSDQTRLFADATYYEWSAFDEIVITSTTVSRQQQQYKDTVSWGFGAEHDYNDKFTARAGVMFDPTPTNDNFRSVRTPDADRTWIAVGGTYSAAASLDIDFALTQILIDDAKIDLTKNLTLSGAPLGTSVTKGTSTGDASIVSLGLRYKF